MQNSIDNASRIRQIFARFAAHNPSPAIELRYCNHFTLLVAIVLSAQTTDKAVNKITDKLFAVADSPESMVALGIDSLRDHIRSIGLFNNKASNIIALSYVLLEKYGGAVPSKFEELITLPGVGRKSANVFLNTALGAPVIAVDRHVFRVSHRLGLSTGKTVLHVERDLLRLTPEPCLHSAHHWLVLHGRYVCLALKPKCCECFLSDICPQKLSS
jgi:endonuclease-3